MIEFCFYCRYSSTPLPSRFCITSHFDTKVRIHALNEYLETFEGQQPSSFRDGSDTYLTKEQYAMVKHVGLNFIICLLCFYYF
jgi:hypothetical protein